MATTADDPTSVVCTIIDATETVPLRHSVLWPNAPISQVLLPEDDKGIHIGAFITRKTGGMYLLDIRLPAIRPTHSVTDGAHITDGPGDSHLGLVAVISLFLESWPEGSEKPTIDSPGVDRQSPFAGATQRAGPPAGVGPGVAVRFRKFACDPSFQGQGIGSRLLEYASQTIARHQLGAKVIWCDARVATSDWYRKRGMVEFGGKFWKSGVEYVRMKREL